MRRPIPAQRARQNGAVLYIALIMLLLLSLIGIAAMQVATLQERMSANYEASAMAFQRAEARARVQERAIETTVAGGEVPATNLPARECATPFDPYGWSNAQPHVRRLDLCFSWGALDLPIDETERTDQIYQITAFNTDRTTATSEAVVDTVFIP